MRVSIKGPPHHPFNRIFPHKPPHMLGYLHIFPHVWGQKSGVIGETRLSCLGDRPKLPFVVLVQQLLAAHRWMDLDVMSNSKIVSICKNGEEPWHQQLPQEILRFDYRKEHRDKPLGALQLYPPRLDNFANFPTLCWWFPNVWLIKYVKYEMHPPTCLQHTWLHMSLSETTCHALSVQTQLRCFKTYCSKYSHWHS